MRKYFPLLLCSMLVCALLVEGTGCSSMSQTTVQDAAPAQSLEQELTSTVASSDNTTSESDAASGDKAHPGNTVDPDNAATSDKVADASEMVDAVDVVDPVNSPDLFHQFPVFLLRRAIAVP